MEMAPRIAARESVAVVFGRERWGLMNDEVGLADRIVTFPVNPAFASLNLAQAVLLVCYEWFKVAGGGLPFGMQQRSPPAGKEQVFAFFATLERELEQVEFFRPAEKRDTMTINLRNIFTRMAPSQQDIQTLHGVVTAMVEGRKGPARGGVLDGHEAGLLREILAEHGEGRVPGERGPVRGLSRLPCGRRSRRIAASPAAASSARCRSGRTLSTSSRSRCAPSSISCPLAKAPRLRIPGPANGHG
jgi:tRNA/rRNA methyltransferase